MNLQRGWTGCGIDSGKSHIFMDMVNIGGLITGPRFRQIRPTLADRRLEDMVL